MFPSCYQEFIFNIFIHLTTLDGKNESLRVFSAFNNGRKQCFAPSLLNTEQLNKWQFLYIPSMLSRLRRSSLPRALQSNSYVPCISGYSKHCMYTKHILNKWQCLYIPSMSSRLRRSSLPRALQSNSYVPCISGYSKHCMYTKHILNSHAKL